jgi:hypothetical protein
MISCLGGKRTRECWGSVLGGRAPSAKNALNQAKFRPRDRLNHTQEVAGSSPASSTQVSASCERDFDDPATRLAAVLCGDLQAKLGGTTST